MQSGGKLMKLCKIGIHRPLKRIQSLFIDKVSGKTVFLAECPCGQHYMTDSCNPWFGFTVRMVPRNCNNQKDPTEF